MERGAGWPGSPLHRNGEGLGVGLLLSWVVDSARLPDDRDLHLAGVLERLLDPLDDVAGEANGAVVVDLVRADDDPDLAASLDRERLLDALERVGDALQRFESFDVMLHAL